MTSHRLLGVRVGCPSCPRFAGDVGVASITCRYDVYSREPCREKLPSRDAHACERLNVKAVANVRHDIVGNYHPAYGELNDRQHSTHV